MADRDYSRCPHCQETPPPNSWVFVVKCPECGNLCCNNCMGMVRASNECPSCNALFVAVDHVVGKVWG